MLKMKDIGNFKTVPPIVTAIVEGNLPALDAQWRAGWDLEKPIVIAKHAENTPLEIALVMESFPSVQWLAEHGANLNDKENPSFCVAVRYCGEKIVRWIAARGADVNMPRGSFGDAYQQALYGGRKENLPLIAELGHSVEKYGGLAFRAAVNPIEGKADFEVLDFFIQNGVDVNYNGADSVYPWRPTPLCVAARYTDLATCRYLVARGADVTLAEKKGGMRPYNIAVERGDAEMEAWFKSLEPAEFHSLQNKLLELKEYKLPQALMDFLQGDARRREFGEEYDIAFVDFFPLVDTVPMKAGRQKVLRLSRETDNYSHIDVVWNPRTKKIAYWDTEHEELGNIAPFEAFLENMADFMQKVVDGEIEG